MAVKGLNHAVLYVRDARTHAAFYEDVLGFTAVVSMPGGRGVFCRAPGSSNDHDVAFFTIGPDASASTAGRGSVGLYHLAWEVETLAELAAIHDRLAKRSALVGASDHVTTKSLYAHDPDGLELEVMWEVPDELLRDDERSASAAILPLDLDAVIARFGADTIGGRQPR